MTIIIEGVRIELTADQIAQIEKARSERTRAYRALSNNSFAKLLKQWKFVKLNTKAWEAQGLNCWEHKEYGWFAEILPSYNDSYLWLVGPHLRDGSMPGGWHYWTIDEATKALSDAATKILSS